jgi:hypothetical protein
MRRVRQGYREIYNQSYLTFGDITTGNCSADLKLRAAPEPAGIQVGAPNVLGRAKRKGSPFGDPKENLALMFS